MRRPRSASSLRDSCASSQPSLGSDQNLESIKRGSNARAQRLPLPIGTFFSSFCDIQHLTKHEGRSAVDALSLVLFAVLSDATGATVNNPKCYPCVDYGKHLQRGGGVSTATTIDLTSTNLDLDPDGEGIKGTAQPSHYT